MQRSCFITLLTITVLLSGRAACSQELVVFSGRNEPLIAPVIALFEDRTGIKVTLKSGDSAALSQQILQELPRPSADVFIGKESGSLEYLRLKGAFEAYNSAETEKVPEMFKARDHTWIGISGRARAVIYNKNLIAREDVPDTLEALAYPRYKGKIAATNAGNESLVAWVSALRIHFGDEYVRTLLKRFKANDIRLISKSHTDIRKAVGRGEYPLGLINHYYYHLQRHEQEPRLTNVGIVYLDQKEGERGELVNVAGAAIVKGTRRLENARKFLDFLASAEAQRVFAEVNFEYPLVNGVAAQAEVFEAFSCAPKTLQDCLRVMDVNLDELGERLEGTAVLLDEVDWN